MGERASICDDVPQSTKIVGVAIALKYDLLNQLD
jgi:hypothetical protein